MRKNSIGAACFLVLLLLASSCGTRPGPTVTQTSWSSIQPSATVTASTPSPTKALVVKPPVSSGSLPLIFDDDGSPDGTTALLYILSHPKASLKAANISYGEAHPKIYIQHIGRMLSNFGISDLPLGYGQDSPLAGTNAFPESVRQNADKFWGLPIPNPEQTYPVLSAPELMVAVIRQSFTPVTIFVSGSLTNLAEALRLDADIRKNVSAVYIMGGAVYVPGNIQGLSPDIQNKVAEWNIFADPQAAQEVFESGLNIYLVPLDATNQVSVNRQDTTQWRQGGKIANFAADIYDMLLHKWGAKEAEVWDLMTAAIMLNPDLCVFRPLHLEVITQAGITSGQTAVVPNEAANASVCLEPDANKIRQELIAVFSASSIGEPTVPAPTSTPTPANQLFRDDFTDSLQPDWTWQNEKPSRWAITPDGWFQITGEDASLLNDGSQSNLLCRNAPEGDFQITLHLSANPVSNFQQATLYLYQDADNYIAVNRGFCSPCGGNGLFMEYKFAGEVGAYQAKTENIDVFLRLAAQGRTITGYYALQPDAWQRFGRVGFYLEKPGICLGVSNVDSAGAQKDDLVGKFDFIEIIRP